MKTQLFFFIAILTFSLLVYSCVSDKEREARNLRNEQEKVDQEAFEKYIDNQLYTGATPYDYLYGLNHQCGDWGCSEIKVTTPSTSEVLVLIKNNDVVVRHAYIRASDSYTFQMRNGTYQPFFYYGNGWNPEKELMQTEAGTVVGGFVSEEHFSKDSPQELENSILEYTLILQQSGNFQEKKSSAQEVF